MLGFHYFKTAVTKDYANFSGVATRTQYGMFVLWSVLITIFTIVAIVAVGLSNDETTEINQGNEQSYEYNYDTGEYEYSDISEGINETLIFPSFPIAAWVLLGVIIIFGLATMIPNISITVRRLHDAGYSGGMYCLGFIPYVGGFVLFIFALLPSSLENNKFRGDTPESDTEIEELKKTVRELKDKQKDKNSKDTLKI